MDRDQHLNPIPSSLLSQHFITKEKQQLSKRGIPRKGNSSSSYPCLIPEVEYAILMECSGLVRFNPERRWLVSILLLLSSMLMIPLQKTEVELMIPDSQARRAEFPLDICTYLNMPFGSHIRRWWSNNILGQLLLLTLCTLLGFSSQA